MLILARFPASPSPPIIENQQKHSPNNNTKNSNHSCANMIRAFSQGPEPMKALIIYKDLHTQGFSLDHHSFLSLTKACAHLNLLFELKMVHAHCLKSGFQSHIYIQTALIHAYGSCSALHFACQMFDEMYEKNVVSYNALISGYGMCGDMFNARKLFDEMPERNLISWNSMLAGYSRAGLAHDALRVLREMHECGERLEEATMVIGLSVCASSGALRMGECIHGYLEKNLCNCMEKNSSNTMVNNLNCSMDGDLNYLGVSSKVSLRDSGSFDRSLALRNALVDMYAKCGDIMRAFSVFERMPDRNVISWTAMISGFALHGMGEKALSIFSRMQEVGVRPNAITFTGVLRACSHVGLVNEGMHFFNVMSRNYHIKPGLEHYGCMVDLFGRAGMLEYAFKLVETMPIEPDNVILRSLISSCRAYGYLELGEKVAKHLIELEPKDEGVHVLLSNIFAKAKRWVNVRKVRKAMKDNGIMKTPGCSWIELKDGIHEFLQGDQRHPQSRAIYEMLEDMMKQMRLRGYIPNTSDVWLNIHEEEKETALSVHCEKLAVAFGLVSTRRKTPIRVMKNLRMCSDCHCVLKAASKIYDREIIMRDRTRFHHFKDGYCSCKDYW